MKPFLRNSGAAFAILRSLEMVFSDMVRLNLSLLGLA